MTKSFDRRLLLGWINDNSSRPLAGKRWPITDVDEQTVRDYAAFFRTAADYGYNGVTLWGLYASHAWPVPLKACLEPARRRLLDRILREAERHRIKVLYGLGVYSWGFEEIIKHDPTTARNEGRMAWGSFHADNGVAMCYHSESARQWMRDIIDLCVKEVWTHGFGFQSGDLGRCYCRECRVLSDIEYHSRVLDETASYVRENHPGQTLGVSAWGIDLGGGAGGLVPMTRHVDFLTDVTDATARMGREYRRSVAAALPCALGSLGGPIIVPPQRWERERWFLPHAALTARNIKSLREDGGRAFEYFMGPLNNPQYAIMTRFVGLLLRDPSLSCEQALSHVVQDLCAPRSHAASDGLVQWLLDAERAYVAAAGDLATGEFDFEPLQGENAGEPIYLTRLSAEGLAAYQRELERLAKQLPAITAGCRKPEMLRSIGRCVENVLKDIRAVQEKGRSSGQALMEGGGR